MYRKNLAFQIFIVLQLFTLEFCHFFKKEFSFSTFYRSFCFNIIKKRSSLGVAVAQDPRLENVSFNKIENHQAQVYQKINSLKVINQINQGFWLVST